MSLTITSAMNPTRFSDSYTEIIMWAWFDEFGDKALPFVASPFDDERHGKELWFRAMAGEFGPITVLPQKLPEHASLKSLPEEIVRAIAIAANPYMHLLTYQGDDANGVDGS